MEPSDISQQAKRSIVTRVISDDYLVTDDLIKIFNRKKLALYFWRKDKNLPYLRLTRNENSSVLYDPQEVLRWAHDNNKRIVDVGPLERVLGRRLEVPVYPSVKGPRVTASNKPSRSRVRRKAPRLDVELPSAEIRLKEAKKIFDKGTITREQFNAMKENIRRSSQD